jgi:PPOX class probable F420-dependent enzyme
MRLLETSRVGRLATADATGRPHMVPVVFVWRRGRIFSPIDGKPKADPRTLRHLRNIRENSQVALLVDLYEEEWAKLAYVLVRGTASILDAGMGLGEEAQEEFHDAESLLRGKYLQYESVPMGGRRGS